ncbi:MAG: hypothetical protein NVSMB5_04030 [Candidatus Velthaea sp.]
MNARMLPLIVGIVLALGTGFLLMNYLGHVQQSVTTKVKTRPVLVALTDIPARSQIRADMLSVVQRPGDELDSDVVTDSRRAIGKMALITIPAGTSVTESKIGPAAALAMTMRLKNGLRAVSISIDKVKGVSGLLEPGDRVDVIAVPPRMQSEMPRATTIIRGALVLAVGNVMETAHATPNPENQNMTTVTLALNPQQANLVSLADLNTNLRLALRSPQEPLRAYPVEPLQLGIPAPPPAPAVISGAAPVAAPVAPPPAAVAPVPIPIPAVIVAPQRVQQSVPVLDGDRYIDAGKK